MKKKLNRIMSLILAAVMVIAVCPADSYAKTSTAVTVTTKAQLNAALSDKSVKKITLKTSKKLSFAVKSGKYKNVALVINAPNSTISNSGVFKSITVNDAGKYEEKASGNSITIKDSKLTVGLDKKAKVSSLVLNGKNADIKLTNAGKITNFDVKSKSKLSIKQNGTVGRLSVNSASNISITGKSKSTMPINVKKAAKGSTITTSAPVKLTTEASVSLNFKKGAEKSSLKIASDKVNVTLKNNSQKSISVTDSRGVKSIASIGKKTIFALPTEAPTATIEPTAIPTATIEPAAIPTATITPSEVPTATVTPTEAPAPTVAPTATIEPSSSPTTIVVPAVSPSPTEEKIAKEEKRDNPDGSWTIIKSNSDGKTMEEDLYTEDDTLLSVINYDTNTGFKTKETLYYEDDSYEEIEYVNDNKKEKSTRTFLNDNGVILSYDITEYDKETGEKTKSTSYYASGNVHYYTLYEYDDTNGKLKKETTYFSGSSYEETEYDVDTGHKSSFRGYSSGELYREDIYNSKTGNKQTSTEYGTDGSITETEYDENGLTSKETVHYKDGTYSITLYIPEDLPIEYTLYNSDDTVIRRTVTKYDPGTEKKTEYTEINSDGSKDKHYEYDSITGKITCFINYLPSGYTVTEYDAITEDVVRLHDYNVNGELKAEPASVDGNTEIYKDYYGKKLFEYVYNEDGKLAKEIYYDANENVRNYFEHKYGITANNTVEVTLYNAEDIRTTRYLYIEDSQILVSKTCFNEDGSTIISRIYDENTGKQISTTYYMPESVYTYEYDADTGILTGKRIDQTNGDY